MVAFYHVHELAQPNVQKRFKQVLVGFIWKYVEDLLLANIPHNIYKRVSVSYRIGIAISSVG
jgi:ABC-type polysaccharide/polyol phosphate export permease